MLATINSHFCAVNRVHLDLATVGLATVGFATVGFEIGVRKYLPALDFRYRWYYFLDFSLHFGNFLVKTRKILL